VSKVVEKICFVEKGLKQIILKNIKRIISNIYYNIRLFRTQRFNAID
jgi:hypothetical protein